MPIPGKSDTSRKLRICCQTIPLGKTLIPYLTLNHTENPKTNILGTQALLPTLPTSSMSNPS